MVRRTWSITGLGVDLAALAIAGGLAWVMWYTLGDAEDQPALVHAAVVRDPTQPADTPATTSASPLDGLKISSQAWRRGGLGSKALVTFTLRNTNDYAVKDIEIACAFARRDGSHLTDRRRVIGETVEMKSRRTFTRFHIGFVNVNADKAKCALVAASRV